MEFFEQRLNISRKRATTRGGDGETMMMGDLMEGLNVNLPGTQRFELEEAVAFLKIMCDDNRVWYREEIGQVVFM